MKNGKNGGGTDQQVIYIFARCEQFIADYARSSGLPEAELTARVATLLHAQAGGEVLGPFHSLPGLPQNGAGRSAGLPEVALAERAPERAQNAAVKDDEAARIRDEAARMRAAGASWQEVVNRLNRSERVIKKLLQYVPGRSYNGSHWMQKPANRKRVLQTMRDRKQKMIDIMKTVKRPNGKHIPRAEFWAKYRQARDKMRARTKP